jgi:ankyrin repeat protein
MKNPSILFAFAFFAVIFQNCYLPVKSNNNYYLAPTDYVYKGDLYGLKSALARGASIEERDPFMQNYTPLMVAAREGNLEIAKWLVENGANVNARARDGHTALMMAAYNRYPDIVKLLIQNGADVHAVSNQGHTALSEIRQNEFKIIEEDLLNAGAKK